MAASKVARRRGVDGVRSGILRWVVVAHKAIPVMRPISPIRLVRPVIIPPARVDGVW